MNENFVELILNASTIVQSVMVLLVFMSLMVWAVTFSKWYQIRKAKRVAQQFVDTYLSSPDLNTFYQQDKLSNHHGQGLSHVFLEGFREFLRLKKLGALEASDLTSGAQRMMKIAFSKEADRLENRLSILATIGSSAPYIGLFGTVLGVMHAFQGLGEMQNATLAAVAPGISEALIVTAMGLFAAIPAVIAYNSLSNRVDRLLGEYENFSDTLLMSLQRDAYLAQR
ncbi:Tol-Pal system protein TolQ [hydrothermal vent metagenome]|uniref:Tol-Pal system protein TolQ n=1 Tax=hydrothermal vent metagenome TaxID=652676 RepID=A0A3B0VU08_9ZZZZ